jgi:hypothetical protein
MRAGPCRPNFNGRSHRLSQPAWPGLPVPVKITCQNLIKAHAGLSFFKAFQRDQNQRRADSIAWLRYMAAGAQISRHIRLFHAPN